MAHTGQCGNEFNGESIAFVSGTVGPQVLKRVLLRRQKAKCLGLVILNETLTRSGLNFISF